MMADDFGFLIALEAPRAGIPAGDDAILVQHIDGVVMHRLHHQAVEALVRFGIAQAVRAIRERLGGLHGPRECRLAASEASIPDARL